MIDIDATLVNTHFNKEGATSIFKKGHGFHPPTAWLDHRPEGGGEGFMSGPVVGRASCLHRPRIPQESPLGDSQR